MRPSTKNDEGLPPQREVSDGARGASVAGRGATKDDTALDIVTDITADFPITSAELDVIERYFGDLLDLVLGGGKKAPVTLSRHKQE